MPKTNGKYLAQASWLWPEFKEPVRKRAQTYLDRYKKKLSKRSKRAVTHNRRLSRAAYIEALAAAYAHFIILSHEKKRKSIVKALMKEAGLKLRGQLDYLGMLCDLHIGYRGVAVRKNLRSRDATAIRFLMSQSVQPDSVLKYKLDGNGGVVAWARAWGQLRHPKPTAVTTEAKTIASPAAEPSTGKGEK